MEALDPGEVGEWLCGRLEELKDAADFVPRAGLLLTLAGAHEESARACGRKALALRPGLAAKAASKEEKALFKKCRAASGGA
ncbi:MAG TPA: hypothetical protein VND93_33315 [Myxococcales bacterium]|nr:hypothetical protein [Myxococcales bacterium]